MLGKTVILAARRIRGIVRMAECARRAEFA
ncbi:hypothetical protein DP44_5861 [Burkholderia pseudomallei]|nr:hypothetical protein DP44_5861 [Burkholderia pseudomallei]KOT11442.1 hypothetical protein DM77_2876 [Burkholderia mallei]KOT23110.1 hypothetical protein DM52_2778 [Burkholderia mallei]